MRRVYSTYPVAMYAFICACLLVATAQRAAAHRSLSPAGEQSLPEWTVMVFMNGDNDLEDFAVLDFEEMARVSDSDRVNIVVQFDRAPGWATEHGDWTHTLRFKLRHGMTPTEANALRPQDSELAEKQETNMGHPDTLSSFVTWARSRYPARRYMLIIWDHGDGWRRLHTVSVQRDLAAAKSIRLADAAVDNAASADDRTTRRGRSRRIKAATFRTPLNRTLDGPHRAISLDVTDASDKLFMREVQNSLEGVVGEQRLDIIGFDACLMAMVENGFAMRRVAQVMVGSEELEPGDGWQYDDWVAQLVAKPTMDAAALGKVLVDSYEKTYTSPSNFKPRTTLSAVNSSQENMEALARAVSALGTELIAGLSADLPAIRGAREACTPYAPGEGFHGIDLHRFCDQLASRTTLPALRERARAVLQLLDSSVIHNYAGSARQGDFGSKGLAIYFPQTKTVYQSDSYGSAYRDPKENESPIEFPVEFVERHSWDNFLHTYFEHVP